MALTPIPGLIRRDIGHRIQRRIGRGAIGTGGYKSILPGTHECVAVDLLQHQGEEGFSQGFLSAIRMESGKTGCEFFLENGIPAHVGKIQFQLRITDMAIPGVGQKMDQGAVIEGAGVRQAVQQDSGKEQCGGIVLLPEGADQKQKGGGRPLSRWNL